MRVGTCFVSILALPSSHYVFRKSPAPLCFIQPTISRAYIYIHIISICICLYTPFSFVSFARTLTSIRPFTNEKPEKTISNIFPTTVTFWQTWQLPHLLFSNFFSSLFNFCLSLSNIFFTSYCILLSHFLHTDIYTIFTFIYFPTNSHEIKLYRLEYIFTSYFQSYIFLFPVNLHFSSLLCKQRCVSLSLVFSPLHGILVDVL